MARRKAALLALVAGVLLMLANFRGGSFLLEVGDRLARQYLIPEIAQTVHVVITLLLLVAGLGGLAVLVGGLCYGRGLMRLGNLLVGLGAGVGILGLFVLVGLAVGAGQTRALMAWLLGPAGIGILLSIWARREAG